MKDLTQKAECNNLLSTAENLAVYNVLYYALSDSKSLTVKDIIIGVEKKFSIELNPNKINYILKGFVDRDIIRKNVKDGVHKYYLYKKIYTPSQNTPVPPYQIILLTISFLMMLLSFIFINNELFKWTSLTFFGTILLVVITHQFMFEYKH